MVKKKDIEDRIKKLVLQNYPEILEEYDLILQPVGQFPSVSSPIIQNLAQAAYYYHKRFPYPSSTMLLFDPVWQLAKIYKEKKYLTELQKIFNGEEIIEYQKTNNIPLCLIEEKISNSRFNPQFDFEQTVSYCGEKWKMHELTKLLMTGRNRLFQIFNDILIKKDITTPVDFFSHSPTEENQGFIEMPK